MYISQICLAQFYFRFRTVKKCRSAHLLIEVEIPFLKVMNKINTKLDGGMSLQAGTIECWALRANYFFWSLGKWEVNRGGIQAQDRVLTWWGAFVEGSSSGMDSSNSPQQEGDFLCSFSYCVASSSSNLDILISSQNHGNPWKRHLLVEGAPPCLFLCLISSAHLLQPGADKVDLWLTLYFTESVCTVLPYSR